MPTIETKVYVSRDTKEYECNVTARGAILTGGSDRHGSDEPAWSEVMGLRLYNQRGGPVSPRFMRNLDQAQIDHVIESLLEA